MYFIILCLSLFILCLRPLFLYLNKLNSYSPLAFLLYIYTSSDLSLLIILYSSSYFRLPNATAPWVMLAHSVRMTSIPVSSTHVTLG